MTGTRDPVIDIHSHLGTPAAAELMAGMGSPHLDPFARYSSAQTSAYNANQFASLAPKLTDPQQRLADMDRMGVDIQVLSVAPPQFYYWAEADLGARVARKQNEYLHEVVSRYPDRFVGLATVPLAHVDAAVAELEYGISELGFRGVEICTSVNGDDLDHDRFRSFFSKAQELGAVVLLHPHGFSHGARLADYYLINVIGNPLDTTVALTRLIHAGVLDEFPKLRLCAVHGGGYLPFYSSRMDHAFRHRPEGHAHIKAPPSHYLRKIYVDSVVYDPAHLAFLIEQIGADRVMLGTDYPYDMGEEDPLRPLAAIAGLSADDRAAITGGNAARLLGLDVAG